jgi:hypothetical protein|nr:MAG TPA: hypothetical protein [Caudoviricetes sp.]
MNNNNWNNNNNNFNGGQIPNLFAGFTGQPALNVQQPGAPIAPQPQQRVQIQPFDPPKDPDEMAYKLILIAIVKAQLNTLNINDYLSVKRVLFTIKGQERALYNQGYQIGTSQFMLTFNIEHNMAYRHIIPLVYSTVVKKGQGLVTDNGAIMGNGGMGTIIDVNYFNNGAIKDATPAINEILKGNGHPYGNQLHVITEKFINNLENYVDALSLYLTQLLNNPTVDRNMLIPIMQRRYSFGGVNVNPTFTKDPLTGRDKLKFRYELSEEIVLQLKQDTFYSKQNQ